VLPPFVIKYLIFSYFFLIADLIVLDIEYIEYDDMLIINIFINYLK